MGKCLVSLIMGRPAFAQHNADRDVTREYPFSEPLIVKALHVDGFIARNATGILTLTGWQTVEPIGECLGERRIVTRISMSEMEAHAFKFALGWALGQGH
jgi:hypothetical protein